MKCVAFFDKLELSCSVTKKYRKTFYCIIVFVFFQGAPFSYISLLTHISNMGKGYKKCFITFARCFALK